MPSCCIDSETSAAWAAARMARSQRPILTQGGSSPGAPTAWSTAR